MRQSTRGSSQLNVLVTGASAGIGRALVQRLVASGHRAWGVARRESELQSLRIDLGERFSYSCADVALPETANRVCKEMARAGFVPDTVVLNAGIFPHDCDELFDSSLARPIFDTNYHGAISFVDELLEPFLASGGGQFLAVSSVFAVRPDPRAVSYAASKAALAMAFRALGVRYRPSAVEFKLLLLGPVDTHAGPGVRPRARYTPSADQAAAAIERALRGRRRLVYYPWLLGAAFRASAWIPDAAFDALVNPFRR